MLAPPTDRAEVETGLVFMPRFGSDGLLVCITVEAATGAILMVAHMNAAALEASLATGIAHYWSRSRSTLWRKGDTSGQVQSIVEMRTDCDQDALLLMVNVGGDGHACHTGHHSCFFRRVHADGTQLEMVPGETLSKVT